MEDKKRRTQEESGGFSQLEDKVMKTAAQFFGEDLLPYVGIKGEIAGVAPTEHVHLEMRKLEEDFNFIMEDGSRRHLEFESDSITIHDLRRFREYDAYVGFTYDVPVVTTVLCTSSVKILKRVLVNGNSVYRVELIRMKDRDADKVFCRLEHRARRGKALRRRDVFPVLLTPMMSGKLDVSQRICKAMDILQMEELKIGEEDKKRMLSVLYALAIKFLNRDELRKVKERIGMTVLGQMLLDEGIERGIERGIQAFILDNIEEGIPRERTMEKLCRRFSIGEREAEAFYERFATAENRQRDAGRCE